MGILPEALLNYLAFLGWNPGDEREYLSRDELVEAFDLSRVQKGSAVFDEIKLLSVNQHWMRALSDERFHACLDFVSPSSDEGLTKSLIPLLKERAKTFKEAREMLSGELSCFFAKPKLDRNRLLAKELPERSGVAITVLKGLLGPINALPEGHLPRWSRTRLCRSPMQRSRKGREVGVPCSGPCATRFPGKNARPTPLPLFQSWE